MKLTNNLRQAFVRAAMDDVPQIDYVEKARSFVNKEVLKAQIKAEISDVDPKRLNSDYQYAMGTSFYCRGLTSEEMTAIMQSEEMKTWSTLRDTQTKTRNELAQNLTAAIAGCNTRKQAVDALPEFEKYLPVDTVAAIRSLPAIANVLTDFVKAGWPKNQKRISI